MYAQREKVFKKREREKKVYIERERERTDQEGARGVRGVNSVEQRRVLSDGVQTNTRA